MSIFSVQTEYPKSPRQLWGELADYIKKPLPKVFAPFAKIIRAKLEHIDHAQIASVSLEYTKNFNQYTVLVSYEGINDQTTVILTLDTDTGSQSPQLSIMRLGSSDNPKSPMSLHIHFGHSTDDPAQFNYSEKITPNNIVFDLSSGGSATIGDFVRSDSGEAALQDEPDADFAELASLARTSMDDVMNMLDFIDLSDAYTDAEIAIQAMNPFNAGPNFW